ncbi:MAG: peptide-methionine (S)-S-oxide reductase [Spirochaetaceae bacterium]|jgi:hypothetical protein|nr:peptide-methionine (S)-S-oxide reductase [Spirochaetaceae bacterium]
MKVIYLAGGCFWGTEKYLGMIPGVARTETGYANGRTENPSYEEVRRQGTGHAETVRVEYDEGVIALEIDRGAIEAAQSMGISPLGIIFRVYLKESIPGIIQGATITFISLVGLTVMVGAVGGGGLGGFAIRYGYQRYQTDVTVVTVIVLIVLVSIIQGIGSFFARRATH